VYQEHFEIFALKRLFSYDYNEKEAWDRATLPIAGSALEDTKIRKNKNE